MKEIDREKNQILDPLLVFYCRYNTIHYDQEYDFNQTAQSIDQSINDHDECGE